MKKLILVSMTTLSILGCSFPLEQMGLFKTGNGLPEVTVFANDTPIDFSLVQDRSLKSCAECHDFTKNADQVIANQNEILARINMNGPGMMPPAGKGRALTECEKQILVTWLDDQKVGRSSSKFSDLSACAAPTDETIPEPTPSPSPTPEEAVDFAALELNYVNLAKYILEPKCLRCHTPVEGKAKTVLTSTSEIQGQELIASTAEASKLYQVVIPGLNKRFMPPPKSGIPALTAEEADYLKRWILSVPPDEFF